MSEVKVAKTNESAHLPASFWETPAWNMSPFSLMRRMSNELEGLFGGNGARMFASSNGAAWVPAVEVEQSAGQFKVRAELPGMKQEDIKVEATAGGLVIEGERRDKHEEKKDGYYRSEHSYGKFCRVLPLPEGAEIDKAKAEYVNGVLEVAVPVPQARKQEKRQIPVQAKTAA